MGAIQVNYPRPTSATRIISPVAATPEQPDAQPCPEQKDSNAWDYYTCPINIPIGVFQSFDNQYIIPPTKELVVASIGPSQALLQFGLFFHLVPCGKQPDNVSGKPITGTEAWLQLKSGWSSSDIYIEGMRIKFKRPITRFYLSAMGTTGNVTINITFLNGRDFDVDFRPAANVTG